MWAKGLRNSGSWENKCRTQQTCEGKQILHRILHFEGRHSWTKNHKIRKLLTEWLPGSNHLMLLRFGFFTENRDESNSTTPSTHPRCHTSSDELWVTVPLKRNFLRLNPGKHKMVQTISATLAPRLCDFPSQSRHCEKQEHVIWYTQVPSLTLKHSVHTQCPGHSDKGFLHTRCITTVRHAQLLLCSQRKSSQWLSILTCFSLNSPTIWKVHQLKELKWMYRHYLGDYLQGFLLNK